MRNRKLMKGITAILTAAMTMSAASKTEAAKSGLSVTDCIISKGDQFDIDVIGGKEMKGKYQILDSQIATVSKKGVVNAKNTGKTTITWKKGKKKYSCKIKVVKAPNIQQEKITIVKNKTKKISVSKYGNPDLKIKWKSENTEIAKVSNGKITGVSEGETIITVKIYGNKKVFKKTVEVVVKEDKNNTTSEKETVSTENKIPENIVEKPDVDQPITVIPEKDTASTDEKKENNSSNNNIFYPIISYPNKGNNTEDKPEKPGEVTTPGGIEPEEPGEITTPGGIEPEEPGEVTTPGGIELEKDQDDIDALQAIIEEQLTNEAEVSEDLDDWQYVWNDEGRLVEIYWSEVNLSGEIDFSGLSELQKLDCSYNAVTGLYISGNEALTELNCNGNKIEELDVSANINLEALSCLDNKLTELDLSNNPYLNDDNVSYDDEVEISWYGAEDTEKDQDDIDALQVIIEEQLSNGAEVSDDLDDWQYVWNDEGRLVEIYWSEVNLSGKIDFSGLSELQKLDCSYNAVTGLYISGNEALTELNCSGNEIEELDVSANINLEALNCYDNKLTELDLRNNPYLNDDNVSYNDEVEISWYGTEDTEKDQYDIDALQAIIEEQIANGAWVSEDLDDAEQYVWNDEGRLVEIYWSEVGLSGEIYFSGLRELQKLDCSNNAVTMLNISGNEYLTDLNCSNNEISELDTSSNAELNFLDCSNNLITELDFSCNEYLTNDNVICDNDVDIIWYL